MSTEILSVFTSCVFWLSPLTMFTSVDSLGNQLWSSCTFSWYLNDHAHPYYTFLWKASSTFSQPELSLQSTRHAHQAHPYYVFQWKASSTFSQPELSLLNLLTTCTTLTLTTLSSGKPVQRFLSPNCLYNLLTTRTERSVNTWLHKPPSTYHRQLYNICTFRWQLWSHYLTAVIFV